MNEEQLRSNLGNWANARASELLSHRTRSDGYADQCDWEEAILLRQCQVIGLIAQDMGRDLLAIFEKTSSHERNERR